MTKLLLAAAVTPLTDDGEWSECGFIQTLAVVGQRRHGRRQQEVVIGVRAYPGMPALLVIGGGIVGSATAFFAARRGFECTVLEARSTPASFSTAVAAGGYGLQLEHADELPLVRRSVQLFQQFEAETGQRRYSAGLQPRDISG